MVKKTLTKSETKSLATISSLAEEGGVVPAMRLESSDPQRSLYAFLLRDLMRKITTKGKNNEQRK